MVIYHLYSGEIHVKKATQQIIRFSLTIILMILTFKGKTWARNVFVVLLSLGILGAVFSLFMSIPSIGKSPFVVMIFIYGLAIYHLMFSASFKKYLSYKIRNQKKE